MELLKSICVEFGPGRVMWSIMAYALFVVDKLVWGPDLFSEGGGGREKGSGDSCSTSVCSWNVN